MVLVLGIVLGPIAESNLNRALILSNNSWTTFITHPISCVFLVVSVVLIVYSLVNNIKKDKEGEKSK